MTSIVPLYGKKAAGRIALVDDEDYDLVMQHRWRVYEKTGPGRRRTNGPYAWTAIRRSDGRRTFPYMHSLITGYLRTDHVNGDGLDNTRGNLRPATNSQNGANQRPVEGCTSRYKGVCWHQGRSWLAQIKVDGHHRNLGYFADEDEAARAYDASALAAWGTYARLNFPEEITWTS